MKSVEEGMISSLLYSGWSLNEAQYESHRLDTDIIEVRDIIYKEHNTH